MGVIFSDVMSEEIMLYKRLLGFGDWPCGLWVLLEIIERIMLLIIMEVM